MHDDFLSIFGLNDIQCPMTLAEKLTQGIVSALFFNGNLARKGLVLKYDKYSPNTLMEVV